jgi:hypothetical protein
MHSSDYWEWRVNVANARALANHSLTRARPRTAVSQARHAADRHCALRLCGRVTVGACHTPLNHSRGIGRRVGSHWHADSRPRLVPYPRSAVRLSSSRHRVIDLGGEQLPRTVLGPQLDQAVACLDEPVSRLVRLLPSNRHRPTVGGSRLTSTSLVMAGLDFRIDDMPAIPPTDCSRSRS